MQPLMLQHRVIHLHAKSLLHDIIAHPNPDYTDYEGGVSYVRFLSGTSAMDRQCVDIAIINDDCKEENESFVFSIGAGGDASVHINDFHADVYIIDDEGTIYVSVVAFLY